jgi:glutathione S-transferase
MLKYAKSAVKKSAAAKKSAPKKAAPKKSKAPAKASKPAKGPSQAERNRFTLYGFAGSGPTYTAALCLSLMKHPFSYMHVSLRDAQHKQPDYLVKNRYGQVPALRDGHHYYVQSAAILLHLAEAMGKFNGSNQTEQQHIREWLFWQWDKLAVPVYRLRARNRGFRQFGEEVRTMYDNEAKAALSLLDQDLAKSEWVAGKKITVADIGVYGVLRYAGDANLDLNAYPHVVQWKKRFESLPGFATPEQLLPMESRLI